MHEDIKKFLDLNKEAIPISIRSVSVILARVMEWLVWVFIGVGVLLNKEYFFVWFVFILTILGLFILFFLYVLLLIIKTDTKNKNPGLNEMELSKSIKSAAINGIVGSSAFYLIIFILFAVLKGMGLIDQLLQRFVK